MKKNTIYKFIITPTLVLLLTGCTFNNKSNNNDDEYEHNWEEETPINIDDEVVLTDSEEYKKFWNTSTKLSFSIELSQQAADFINTYQCDHNDSTYFDYYVPCTFTLTMDDQVYTYEEVGIREKGNMSRRGMLVNNNFSIDKLVHYKLSFKETFDDEEYTSIEQLNPFKKTWEDSSLRKERKNRTLFDMEKIDIKWNRNDDQTKVKQSYALRMFRDNGVLAGHSSLAETSLKITGKSPISTTYEVLECIDSVFIKRHFNAEHADGDLYKCTYTDRGSANFNSSYTVGNQIGVEKNAEGYHPVYDLKTNKKKNTTHTSLLNLFNLVNSTTNADSWKQDAEQLIDMNSFMKYEAIAYLCGNFDDMRNNANNYYLYITSGNTKAYFIPYDFDRCFGMGCEGRKDYMTNFSPESTKMQCNGDWQSINLYWRTVCTSTKSHTEYKQVEDYRALYQKNIEDLINNKTISFTSFNSYVNSFHNSFSLNSEGSGNDNISFKEYMDKKIKSITDNSKYKIDVE